MATMDLRFRIMRLSEMGLKNGQSSADAFWGIKHGQ